MVWLLFYYFRNSYLSTQFYNSVLNIWPERSKHSSRTAKAITCIDGIVFIFYSQIPHCISLCSGYAAQSYELLQAPFKSRPSSITTDPDKRDRATTPRNSISEEMCKLTVEESTSHHGVNGQTCLNAQDPSHDNALFAKSMGSLGVPSHPQRALPELSKQETQSLVLSNKSQDSASKVDDFLSSLVIPHRCHTMQGKGSFEDLYLPPLPAPGMSQVLAAAVPSKTPIPVNSSSSSTVGNHMDILGSVLEEEPASSSQDSKSSEMTLSVSDLATKQKPLGSPGHSLTTSNSRKKLYGQDSVTKMKKNSSKVMELSKEKLHQVTREKYCPTGMHISLDVFIYTTSIIISNIPLL